ncbi:hypothetical protein BC629DRAFT_1473521 [Irpex lacteus]|nr:hypothetical protein BC629DRAFT_1473521 [Irpex lacteus]
MHRSPTALDAMDGFDGTKLQGSTSRPALQAATCRPAFLGKIGESRSWSAVTMQGY